MGTAVGWVATFASTAILSVVRAGRSAELDAVGGTLIAVVVGGIVGGSSTAILSIVGADGGVELVVAMVSEGPTGGAGGEVVGGMATAILSVVGAGFCVVPVTNHRIIPPSTVATTPSEMRRSAISPDGSSTAIPTSPFPSFPDTRSRRSGDSPAQCSHLIGRFGRSSFRQSPGVLSSSLPSNAAKTRLIAQLLRLMRQTTRSGDWSPGPECLFGFFHLFRCGRRVARQLASAVVLRYSLRRWKHTVVVPAFAGIPSKAGTASKTPAKAGTPTGSHVC